MLNEIKICINNKQVEKAYDLIVYYEKLYMDNDFYWQLKGELCDLINEYTTAMNCYIKSIELNSFNKYAIERVISISSNINDMDTYELYNKMLCELESRIDYEFKSIIKNDYYDLDDGIIYESVGNDNFYFKDGILINNTEYYYLDRLDYNKNYENTIFVPFTRHYVDNIREISSYGFSDFKVIVVNMNKFEIINIDKSIIEMIKSQAYKNTITISRLSASDSNCNAIIKYIPEKYKDKYRLNIIEGWDVLSLENKIKVPLKSMITISGFEVFLHYPIPSLTYNIEVGHASMIFKSVGNMAKKNKEFAFTPREYKNVNKVCVSSNLDMIMQSAATALSEDKFLISGMPRTDTLLKSDGRKNLEKLLHIKLADKKVILNMPTFHKHDGSGMIQGDESLNNYMKIVDFDYEQFDNYLSSNNMICVMKVHHAETNTVKNNRPQDNFKNIYFVDNSDLESNKLDLYEIVNAGDILITDYSSIYSDFLFMNKPIVFTNCDIEKYREDIGLMLEPYDFWTAGPKVKNQKELQQELLKSLDSNYYREERERLRPVFFNKLEGGATERVWDLINSVVEEFV